MEKDNIIEIMDWIAIIMVIAFCLWIHYMVNSDNLFLDEEHNIVEDLDKNIM